MVSLLVLQNVTVLSCESLTGMHFKIGSIKIDERLSGTLVWLNFKDGKFNGMLLSFGYYENLKPDCKQNWFGLVCLTQKMINYSIPCFHND